MAKSKTKEKIGKVSFGVRRKGKFKKSKGPKDKHKKRYIGQGR